MAAISNLEKVQTTGLAGQVDSLTRPSPEKSAETSPPDREKATRPQGDRDDVGDLTDATSGIAEATYDETREVAARLQTRIDELASEPHQVSIKTDEESRVSIIEIKDPDGKVLKQFPPEKVLNLHQRLDDLSGMVIDEVI